MRSTSPGSWVASPSVGGLVRGSRLGRLLAPVACASVLAAASSGCANTGQYVWYAQLPPQAEQQANEYVIAAGDTVSIRVLGHDEMTLREKVRSDGRIALLLIGDVIAAGKRPSALKAELEGRLKDYIVSPSVSVNIDEVQALTVLVLGEVLKPGVIPLEQDPRLARAIALAGGLTDYASRSSIYVVRGQPKPVRIRFTYESIYRDISGAGDFPLQRGDLIEVE
jgi:polysaccharide export outer membrane protein